MCIRAQILQIRGLNKELSKPVYASCDISRENIIKYLLINVNLIRFDVSLKKQYVISGFVAAKDNTDIREYRSTYDNVTQSTNTFCV